MHRSAVRHLIDENRGFVVMGSRRSNTLLLFSALVLASLSLARSKPPDANAVRWAEGAPGSTFSRGADGKYSYGLRSKDLIVTLTVDAQELQLTRRRLTHFLGVFLDVRYEGAGTLVFDPNTATLEYSSHYRVMKASLDPEGFAERIESGGEEVSDETGRHVEKHPESKEQSEALARAYQKDVAESARIREHAVAEINHAERDCSSRFGLGALWNQQPMDRKVEETRRSRLQDNAD